MWIFNLKHSFSCFVCFNSLFPFLFVCPWTLSAVKFHRQLAHFCFCCCCCTVFSNAEALLNWKLFSLWELCDIFEHFCCWCCYKQLLKLTFWVQFFGLVPIHFFAKKGIKFYFLFTVLISLFLLLTQINSFFSNRHYCPLISGHWGHFSHSFFYFHFCTLQHYYQFNAVRVAAAAAAAVVHNSTFSVRVVSSLIYL